MISSTAAVIVMYNESVIHRTISIFFTLFYALLTMAILFITSVLIKYQNYEILSLIIQIIVSYATIAVTYNLIQINYGQSGDLANADNCCKGVEINKFSHKRSNKIEKLLHMLDDNIIAFSTVFTVILSLSLGIVLKQSNPEEWTKQRSIKNIGFLGELYFRVLRALILPLIFSSLVFSMANIDSHLTAKIGARTFCYYLLTSFIAIVLGIVFVVLIKPGSRSLKQTIDNASEYQSTSLDAILDLIRNLFADNIITACFETYQTVLTPNANVSLNETHINDWHIGSTNVSATNMMAIVMFAIVFGVIVGHMKDDGKPLLAFMHAFLGVIMKITEMLVQITPIGVLFIVLPHVLAVKEVSALLASLGWYALTCVIGMLFHGFVVLPLIYFAATRKNPYAFLGQISSAAMTAFGTASSSATMPVTIQCLEQRSGLDSRVVRFIVPLGATVNMDGTALYESVAAIFIAQYREIELTLAQIVIISIIGTVVSVGAAGIPSAGPIMLMIVLSSVGLPIEDAAIIFVVDWFVDRFRTALNVMGDAFGVAVVHHFSVNDLHSLHIPSHMKP